MNPPKKFTKHTLFCLIFLAVCACAPFQTPLYGQLSQNSGINSNDTYVVLDLNIQSSGTMQVPAGVRVPGADNITSIPAAIVHSNYHVEIGFDAQDQMVLNITPTDPPDDPTAPLSQTIGLIQVRANQMILYDGNLQPLPIAVPVGASTMSSLFPGGLSLGASLTSVLMPSDPTALANALGGTSTVKANNTAIDVISISSATSSAIFRYKLLNGVWTLATFSRIHDGIALGQMHDDITYSIASSNTSATGDARRAANAAPAGTYTAPIVNPPSVPMYPGNSSSYPVIGPGAGAALTLIHGLGGSGGPTGSWGHRMEPWLSGDMAGGGNDYA